MPPPGPVRAFLSYAHEDHVWRDSVLNQLGWLRHSGQLQAFDGGASGIAGAADATLFEVQGIFIP